MACRAAPKISINGDVVFSYFRPFVFPYLRIFTIGIHTHAHTHTYYEGMSAWHWERGFSNWNQVTHWVGVECHYGGGHLHLQTRSMGYWMDVDVVIETHRL